MEYTSHYITFEIRTTDIEMSGMIRKAMKASAVVDRSNSPQVFHLVQEGRRLSWETNGLRQAPFVLGGMRPRSRHGSGF